MSQTEQSSKSLVSMTSLRSQAVTMAMQLWLEHGVHPVHVRYTSVRGDKDTAVEATLSNASEAVTKTGGDPYTMVARGAYEAPESTHVFCIPHNSPEGDILVIAEGGGEFSPGHYRIAAHPTLHDVLAEESLRYRISQNPLDVQEGGLISAALN